MGKISDAIAKNEAGIKKVQYDKSNSEKKENDDLINEQENRIDNLSPLDNHDKQSPLVILSRPHAIESEQFRQLKNTILFPEKGEPPKNIMITSALPNEGKSFVSSNLAIAIAQSIDEYVLLMDCDLRKPTIHSNFNVDNAFGLSDYLRKNQPLTHALKKTVINKLTILPGGTIPINPSELLSSEQMRRLLHEVRLRYRDRYVIVDTPPPTLTSETNAIARQMDGIILVVREGFARKRDIQYIIDLYGKEKILGVVKNFASQIQRIGYGYSKYGYSKYGYYGAYGYPK